MMEIEYKEVYNPREVEQYLNDGWEIVNQFLHQEREMIVTTMMKRYD